MNLIEAVKSGKPFKRKQWSGWAKEGEPGLAYWIDNNRLVPLSLEDAIAPDWEVKEEKQELKAWVNKHTGEVLFSVLCPSYCDLQTYIRAPHLDFPEEK